HLHQRPGRRLQREPVYGFLADDAQGWRQIAPELRLESDHFTLEHLAKPRAVAKLDLDLRAGLEVLAVDEGELRIVEGQGALAEEVDVQVDVHLREPRVLVQLELFPGQAYFAVRGQPVRVGIRHDHLTSNAPAFGLARSAGDPPASAAAAGAPALRDRMSLSDSRASVQSLLLPVDPRCHRR